MNINGQRLLDLLPALYRLRDAEVANGAGLEKGPLESLLDLIGEQLAVLSNDIDQLYDDQFIETCAAWVIPYIGDLIGYQEVSGVSPSVASPRAEVANTIGLRRRKGTTLMLEQVARDVTGWSAHAVEFFRQLAGTQYMNHIRPDSGGTPDLRLWKVSEYENTAFDRSSHSVDVRRIASGAPRNNIGNIGVFLWSLGSYSETLLHATPVTGTTQCFRFSTLGADMPLFTRQVSQGAQITSAAQPSNMPQRLSRRVLCNDVQSPSPVYYGIGSSLTLYLNGTALKANQIKVCNLSGADGQWANLPAAGDAYAVTVDPELGRLALPPVAAGATEPNIKATFYYGFNADMGSGEYPRSSSFTAASTQTVLTVPGDHPTVHEALAALNGDGVVEISGTNIYSEPTGLTVAVKAGGHIELRAADSARPTLILGAAITVTGGALGAFDMNGLLVTLPPPTGGGTPANSLVHVPATAGNQLAHLGITHCTLVPGWSLNPDGSPTEPAKLPSVLAEIAGLNVAVSKSIVGALQVHARSSATLADSIIDSNSPSGIAYQGLNVGSAGGALSCTACTVIGKVHATLFTLVSNSIILALLAAGDTWPAALWADRRQQGCVRFSYLPARSIVPKPYECVTQAQGTPGPQFSTLRYGSPQYGKLLAFTDDSIRRGADDGSEMGAFHFVMGPLREADLRVRLAEYLAVGMECGLIYAT